MKNVNNNNGSQTIGCFVQPYVTRVHILIGATNTKIQMSSYFAGCRTLWNITGSRIYKNNIVVNGADSVTLFRSQNNYSQSKGMHLDAQIFFTNRKTTQNLIGEKSH